MQLVAVVAGIVDHVPWTVVGVPSVLAIAAVPPVSRRARSGAVVGRTDYSHSDCRNHQRAEKSHLARNSVVVCSVS